MVSQKMPLSQKIFYFSTCSRPSSRSARSRRISADISLAHLPGACSCAHHRRDATNGAELLPRHLILHAHRDSAASLRDERGRRARVVKPSRYAFHLLHDHALVASWWARVVYEKGTCARSACQAAGFVPYRTRFAQVQRVEALGEFLDERAMNPILADIHNIPPAPTSSRLTRFPWRPCSYAPWCLAPKKATAQLTPRGGRTISRRAWPARRSDL